jgi:RNA polymerase sigma-70 factor (ECF subfamily)
LEPQLTEQAPFMAEHPQNEVESDSAIIKAIVNGESDQFRKLITRHQNRIFSLVNRQVQDLQELTHEIFVKAYLNLKKFRFESKFTTWLTRIALNHVNSYFSSKKFKQQKRTESFDPGLHDRMASSSMDNERERKNLISQFKEALAALSPKLRDVIVLCGLEGKSYEEAAEVLGIPIGTVRSRLNTARLNLKTAVGTFDGGGE